MTSRAWLTERKGNAERQKAASCETASNALPASICSIKIKRKLPFFGFLEFRHDCTREASKSWNSVLLPERLAFALHLRPPTDWASPERYPFTVLTARMAAVSLPHAEPESFTPSVGIAFSCKVHLAYDRKSAAAICAPAAGFPVYDTCAPLERPRTNKNIIADFFVKRKKNVQNPEHFFSVLLQACTPYKKPAVRA